MLSLQEHRVCDNSRSQLAGTLVLLLFFFFFLNDLQNLAAPWPCPLQTQQSPRSTHALQLVRPPLTTGCLFARRIYTPMCTGQLGSLRASKGPSSPVTGRPPEVCLVLLLLAVVVFGEGSGIYLKSWSAATLWAMTEWSVISWMLESWARPARHYQRLPVNRWHTQCIHDGWGGHQCLSIIGNYEVIAILLD